MSFVRKCLCVLMAALLLVPAAGAMAEQLDEVVGVNDTGFTFFGLDMGDRSIGLEKVGETIFEKTGAEMIPASDTRYVVPIYETYPVCLGGYAATTNIVVGETTDGLIWGADSLLLPGAEVASEDSYLYETAEKVFEDSRKILAEIYGTPDEVLLVYWDEANQKMEEFKLVNEQFMYQTWSMVEQSVYGFISVQYGNAVVRLQREVQEDYVFHTCWLNLRPYAAE